MTAQTDRLNTALDGRYRILRHLGEGGMASVYLCDDIKHDRKVALKLLKPELAAVLGADRFVQEIKTTAALQHPHILPLFDSGAADGFLFYVMPFIDGETLRDKLNRETQLGIDEAVRIAREVLDALHYAHEHGIVHRDVKPENILLHGGHAMVADFGIALAVSAAAGGRMTETGLSLGTPHYMSPEQATAEKDISARSDVYSLGSVLYEMLTGQPPHLGGSAQQIIMKIITTPAEMVTVHRKSVPPNVAAAVARSLEKLPADRFESAKAFAEALGNPTFMITGATGAKGTTMGAVSGRARLVHWAIGAGVGALVTIAGVFLLRAGQPAPEDAPVMRAEFDFLTRTDSGVSVSGLDISPDGTLLVYAAQAPGAKAYQLYLRHLDDRLARPIPGTEGALEPVFSPNGTSIAYIDDRKAIRRIPVGGGTVETVVQGAEQSAFFVMRWGADDFIYYDDDGSDAIYRVSAKGGAPQAIVKGGGPEYPEPLPGGRTVLYTGEFDNEVRAMDVATGKSHALGLKAARVRYLSEGYLLLLGTDALRVVPFNARTLTVKGAPQAILDSAATNGTVADLVIAANGTAAYSVRARNGRELTRAVLVDVAGAEQRVALEEARFLTLRYSPDGRRVAYTTMMPQSDSAFAVELFVHDLVVGTTTRVTRWPGKIYDVAWMPDGAALVFGAGSGAFEGIMRARADGANHLDTLWGLSGAAASNNGWRLPLSVSSDGKRVLLQRNVIAAGKLSADLLTASLDASLGAASDYLVANWDEADGRLSPDGRWVVYRSTEDAQFKVYVRSFPTPGERYVVSDSIGAQPRWAPDGKTIYYWRGRTLVAASVATSPTFRVTARRDLFTRQHDIQSYDINPNGRQFLMLAPTAAGVATTQASAPTRLVVVGNWVGELRRKLGARR